jgi:hypothetical protein
MRSREPPGHLLPPSELDPIARFMFYRGWPLSPWIICYYHGGRWQTEDGSVHFALVIDGIISVAIGSGVYFATKYLIHKLPLTHS